ncbi:CDP-diacylglycerol--glycerol-3-phosphate 3-phosphatidyltransferase, partial [bacterium]|nr:CDP-diacylglycerol--glycerol-3-phosphate 3-phosphatidyltransferase [bacterium]
MLDVVPLWPVIVILFRDIFTTVLRIYAEKVGKPVITSKSAKLKTVLQMVYISAVLALFMLKSSGLFGGSPEDYDVFIYSSTVYYAMLGLTGFTVWTAIEYIYQNRKILFN